jgi:hypothetical protein
MGNFDLFVDDNYHFADENERYKAGSYDSYAEAVVAAEAIVDEWLIHSYRPGITSEELYKGYTMYGEDPYIVENGGMEHLDKTSGTVRFSAWEYAKKRCEELCRNDMA